MPCAVDWRDSGFSLGSFVLVLQGSLQNLNGFYLEVAEIRRFPDSQVANGQKRTVPRPKKRLKKSAKSGPGLRYV